MPECPACHITSDYVYIGAIHVECPNEHCPHFNQETKEASQKAKTPVPEAPEDPIAEAYKNLYGYNPDTALD